MNRQLVLGRFLYWAHVVGSILIGVYLITIVDASLRESTSLLVETGIKGLVAAGVLFVLTPVRHWLKKHGFWQRQT